MKKNVIVTVYLLASMSIVSAAQTSLNFSYDANGNLIQDNDYVYEYNDWNQMFRMRLLNGTIVSEYSYDNEGNRYKKVVNSTNETTYYPNENFIQSRNSTGLFETFFYYEDDTLVARKDPNGSIYYYHPDHLGSTDVITTSGGAVFEDMDYLPFGDELVNSTSRYLYTGKELDRESDLDYFGARYYSPYLKQFIQGDTIIPDVYNPQSLNRYAYVLNNPYKYKDEDGKNPVLLALGYLGLSALAGAITGAYQSTVAISEAGVPTGEILEHRETVGIIAKETGKGAVAGVGTGIAALGIIVVGVYTKNPAVAGEIASTFTEIMDTMSNAQSVNARVGNLQVTGDSGHVMTASERKQNLQTVKSDHAFKEIQEGVYRKTTTYQKDGKTYKNTRVVYT